jgi:DNA-3-methyladenine glycosylase II
MQPTTTLSTITGTLVPRPPFDFAKSLGFLDAFSPTAGEQAIDNLSLTKAVTLNGRAVAFELRNSGTIDQPALSYTLYSEQPLDEDAHEAMRDRIRFFLSLDDDLAPFYSIGQADPQFALIISRLYGLHQPKFLTPFEITCWAVLCQRIPLPIAHQIKLALVERWGTSITINGETYCAFPEPQQLAAVDPTELATVVRNTRKVDYLQAVIHYFLEVDEHWLRSGNYDEVAAALKSIRGIGEWSLHFILVRGLGRMEGVSSIDKELLKAAEKIYNQGQPMTPNDIQPIIDRYRDTQGFWALYSRIATIPDMEKAAETM